MASSVSTRQIAQAYGWDIRTIQGWAKEGVISPDTTGSFFLGDVISKVDHWRVNTINRKMGEEGSKKQSLEVQRLEGQVLQLHIENEKLTGKLRDSDKVARVAFSRAKLEAEMLNSLPSRLKSILAAESDEFKVGQILQAEIEMVLKKTIDASKSEW